MLFGSLGYLTAWYKRHVMKRVISAHWRHACSFKIPWDFVGTESSRLNPNRLPSPLASVVQVSQQPLVQARGGSTGSSSEAWNWVQWHRMSIQWEERASTKQPIWMKNDSGQIVCTSGMVEFINQSTNPTWKGLKDMFWIHVHGQSCLKAMNYLHTNDFAEWSQCGCLKSQHGYIKSGIDLVWDSCGVVYIWLLKACIFSWGLPMMSARARSIRCIPKKSGVLKNSRNSMSSES